MKKFFKRLLSLAMVLMLLPAGTILASDSDLSIPEDKVYYLTSVDSSGLWANLSIYGTGAYNVKNVKSSKPSVIEVLSSRGSKSTWKEHSYSDDTDTTGNGEESAYINFYAKKAGASSISYKIGKKTYKTKVTVKKYVNPVSSAVLTGVNGGKNFASKFKKASYNSSTLKIAKSSSKFRKLTVKANSGWEITSISLSSYSDSGSYLSYSFSEGVSSKSVYVGPIAKGKECTLNISFRNKKDGGYITISSYLK